MQASQVLQELVAIRIREGLAPAEGGTREERVERQRIPWSDRDEDFTISRLHGSDDELQPVVTQRGGNRECAAQAVQYRGPCNAKERLVVQVVEAQPVLARTPVVGAATDRHVLERVNVDAPCVTQRVDQL